MPFWQRAVKDKQADRSRANCAWAIRCKKCTGRCGIEPALGYPCRMRLSFTKMHGLGNDFVVGLHDSSQRKVGLDEPRTRTTCEVTGPERSSQA